MAGNSFGTAFRFTTWGESHGPAIGAVVDGVPPRLPLTEADIQHFLDKRKPGQSRFTTQRQEPDIVKIQSGVFEGLTTGTPISLVIENQDQRSKDYGDIAAKFRPGHADFTYQAKYGIRDYRGGGRSSARETASRVAAGAIARKVLGDWRHDPGRAGPDRPAPHRPVTLGLGPDRRQPLLLPRCRNGLPVGNLPGRGPQIRLQHRRRDRGGRIRRSRRLGRSDLRQAGQRSGAGHDDDQRRQGRGDRRRLRVGRAFRRSQRGRDAERSGRGCTLPVEPCRRHPGRHFHRSGHRRTLRGEADQFHPVHRARPSISTATRRKSSPRAGTIPASASAPCRWARP